MPSVSDIPNHAVDWRLFLPARKTERILLLERGDSDFGRSFRELKIPFETASSLTDLPAQRDFDLVAAPLGLDASASLPTLRDLLRPGGTLLFGFARRDASLAAMTRSLRGLGFRSVQFFAAIPDLISPEYILPLGAQELSFMLAHRYEHKLPRLALRAIASGALFPFMGLARHLLPNYFAVASDGGETFSDALTRITASQLPHASRLRWTLHSNGGADLNDNVIFLGFEHGKRNPSLVAKAPRLPSNNWVVQTESSHLSEIWTLLGKDAPRRLPEPIALAEVDGQAALVISYVDGQGLIHSSRNGLWNDPARLLKLASDAARSLREVHERAAKPLAAGERVPSDLPRKIEAFRKLFSPSEAESRLLAELEQAASAQASTHKTLIQGDFWHGNIIRGAKHGDLMLIDWQYARWDSDVSLDVYLFLLAGALANTHTHDAQSKARGAAELLAQWRAEIVSAYLAAYGAADKFSLLPARLGMLQCCIEKATRAALDFGSNQSDAEAWRWLFYELSQNGLQSL
ncbi:MAG: aminoglycoside phosphotransferase family protein [Chloroflexi bacterium]|nr:aminoglycoside phosphotransferase family protein [Chloroflexota bacterium]